MSTEILSDFAVLQEGTLPLTWGGSVRRDVEHICTSVLIWPEGGPQNSENSLVTDPCFSDVGSRLARKRLKNLGLDFDRIAFYFVTHPHGDHLPFVPEDAPQPHWSALPAETFEGPRIVPCPGHDPELNALCFRARLERCDIARNEMPSSWNVWVVGDAILDLDWLAQWGYYWPNGYTHEEIQQTWRSVARIVSEADLVIPGHGPPIAVDAALVKALVDQWPTARFAPECPDVLDALNSRLQRLSSPPE